MNEEYDMMAKMGALVRNQEYMNTLGGDAKQQNSPSEIYANVRRKAFEDVAAIASNPRYGANHLECLRDILRLCDKETA